MRIGVGTHGLVPLETRVPPLQLMHALAGPVGLVSLHTGQFQTPLQVRGVQELTGLAR